jgi:hypothetical protein
VAFGSIKPLKLLVMQTETIIVKDIQAGSRIELETGEVVRINNITKGWTYDSSFLHYSNGQWSYLLNNDRVTLYSGK